MNLGLRYEIESPLREANNRSVRGFDATAAQPMEAAARAALNTAATGISLDQFHVRGGLTFAGVNGQPEALYDVPKNNWMPRVGRHLQAERQDRAARRLRHVLRVPRPAARRRHHERVQLQRRR